MSDGYEYHKIYLKSRAMTLRIELDILQHFPDCNMTVLHSLQFAVKCLYRIYLMLCMIIMQLTIFEMMN